MTDQAGRDSALLESHPESQQRDKDQGEPHQGAGEDDYQLEGRDQLEWEGGVWPEYEYYNNHYYIKGDQNLFYILLCQKPQSNVKEESARH